MSGPWQQVGRLFFAKTKALESAARRVETFVNFSPMNNQTTKGG